MLTARRGVDRVEDTMEEFTEALNAASCQPNGHLLDEVHSGPNFHNQGPFYACFVLSSVVALIVFTRIPFILWYRRPYLYISG